MLRPRLPTAILHPVRLLPLSFLALIFVGTVVLLLPFARSGEGSASLPAAIFTVDVRRHGDRSGHRRHLHLLDAGGAG